MFYCTYPIENGVWMLISRIQQLLQGQRLACATLTNGPQREANECMWSAPRHPQPVLVGECLSAREISVRRLQNYRTLMTPHSTRSPSSYQHRHRVNDWQQTAVSAAQRRDNAGNCTKQCPLNFFNILIYMCLILFVKISSCSSWLSLQICINSSLIS